MLLQHLNADSYRFLSSELKSVGIFGKNQGLENGTKRNGKNGKFSETKRNGTEKNHKIKKRNETKRKATGNETKHNDII
jgi:hypothetical protein